MLGVSAVIYTGSNSQTVVLEGDITGSIATLFPCSCGEIHHGEYAHELFIEHTCTHDDPLFNSGDGQWMCVECGKVFYLEGEDEQTLQNMGNRRGVDSKELP